MNSPAADLQLYYARRAAEYEAIYAKPERQADLARLATDVAEAFRGRSVIEVACGTGYWTSHLARHAARVDAFDINEEMLVIARTKELDPARVRFGVADAYAVPVPGTRYDAAYASFWWSHVAKRELPRFLQGLHRALAPGARVVFLDNRFVAGSSTPISRQDPDGDTWQTRTLSDGSRHEVLKNFPAPAELEGAVRPYANAETAVEVRLFDYYWWLEYTLAAAPR